MVKKEHRNVQSGRNLQSSNSSVVLFICRESSSCVSISSDVALVIAYSERETECGTDHQASRERASGWWSVLRRPLAHASAGWKEETELPHEVH